MMLQPIDFSYEQCLTEAQELQAFLGSHQSLKERDEVLPFFKERRHLSAFLGVYNYHTIKYDRVAHEYPLFGDFTCDLVAGDWQRRGYVFVEFENGAPDSIFVKKRSKNTPEWSPRFEHGFSQIVDWFYKLDTQRQSADFEERFGDRVVRVSGLLIVGRREDFGPRERDRLKWRQQHIDINGNKVHCLTFDDLCDETLARLAGYPFLQKSPKAANQATATDGAVPDKGPAQSDAPPGGP
jgi:hypothetical protein